MILLVRTPARRRVRDLACCAAGIVSLFCICGAGDARAAQLPAQAASGALAIASRNLRAAELRDDDETTREFYRQAAQWAEKALAQNPDSAEANFVLFAARGRILLAEGVLTNLLELHSIDRYLERALELDPNHPGALAAKGRMLLDLPFWLGGDPSEAEQVLRRSVELHPTGPGTRVGLAKALLHNGDVSGARRQLMLAAHYACVQHRAKTLVEVNSMLSQVDSRHAKATLP